MKKRKAYAVALTKGGPMRKRLLFTAWLITGIVGSAMAQGSADQVPIEKLNTGPFWPKPGESSVILGPFDRAKINQALQRRDPEAFFEMGCRYFRGEGVPLDYGRAATAFDEAATWGGAPMQPRIVMFLNEMEVGRNPFAFLLDAVAIDMGWLPYESGIDCRDCLAAIKRHNAGLLFIERGEKDQAMNVADAILRGSWTREGTAYSQMLANNLLTRIAKRWPN